MKKLLAAFMFWRWFRRNRTVRDGSVDRTS
jgi:hypothetical protein